MMNTLYHDLIYAPSLDVFFFRGVFVTKGYPSFFVKSFESHPFTTPPPDLRRTYFSPPSLSPTRRYHLDDILLRPPTVHQIFRERT